MLKWLSLITSRVLANNFDYREEFAEKSRLTSKIIYGPQA